MGIRAEESRTRAQLLPWSVNNSLTTRSRGVFNWLPIFGESLDDVPRWHWESRTALHPVYVPEFHRDGTMGGYLRRSPARCASLPRIMTWCRSRCGVRLLDASDGHRVARMCRCFWRVHFVKHKPCPRSIHCERSSLRLAWASLRAAA
jgi:hypothetical protein